MMRSLKFPKALLGLLCAGAFLLCGTRDLLGQNESAGIEKVGTATYDKLRKQYAVELKKAHEPIDEGYLRALNRLLDELAAEGDLEGSLEVKKRIEHFEHFRKEYADMMKRALADGKQGPPVVPVAKKDEKPLRKMQLSHTSENPFDEFSDVMVLKETTWEWMAPGSVISFGADGSARVSHPTEVVPADRANYRWERVSKDTFKLESQDRVVRGELRILTGRKTADWKSGAPRVLEKRLTRKNYKG